VQVGEQARQHVRDQRTARARRLRYLKDNKEVQLPALPSGAEKERLLKELHPKTPKNELGLVPQAGPFHVFRELVGNRTLVAFC
jgi:hypothetical protein